MSAHLDQLLQQGLIAHQQGNLAAAESTYRKILSKMPRHFDALHLLGVLLGQKGHYQPAIEHIQRALRVNPGHAAAHSNLGNMQLEFGLLNDALASYNRALDLQPNFTDALFNRGNTLKKLKAFEAALNSFNQVLALSPDHLGALINRGNLLQDMGRDHEAVACYERVLTRHPGNVQALVCYSHLQSRLGNAAIALRASSLALMGEDSIITRSAFFNVVKRSNLSITQHLPLAPLLIRALSEPWGRPHELAAVVIGLLKQDGVIRHGIDQASRAWPEPLPLETLLPGNMLLSLGQNTLLQSLLENTLAADIGLEKFLTLARQALLKQALALHAAIPVQEDCLNFAGMLAQQCFINEYVFCCTPDELQLAESLKHRLENGFQSGETINPFWIAVVASYFPLHSVKCASALANFTATPSLAALIRQQILEPGQESDYALQIPKIGHIRDSVSQQVQQQYEQNPYPRWAKYAPQRAKNRLQSYLEETFPHAVFTPASDAPSYLIAGCGTGQQAVDVAESFITSRIVAADLSIKSLSFALRKTHELGIQGIEYAQADIMELGSTGWRFDVIESVGVLHHLANPLAGWKILTALLNSGGLMKLGFYSEVARKNLNMAIPPSTVQSSEKIREQRQQLLLNSTNPQYADIFAMRDFFSTSECRDLLFHVQEHRFNLLQLKEMLGALGLRLLGFQLPEQVLAQYANRFPEDISKTDLDNWHVYELENPYTFIGMYQFWVQKHD